jgi:hypothetical protein
VGSGPPLRGRPGYSDQTEDSIPKTLELGSIDMTERTMNLRKATGARVKIKTIFGDLSLKPRRRRISGIRSLNFKEFPLAISNINKKHPYILACLTILRALGFDKFLSVKNLFFLLDLECFDLVLGGLDRVFQLCFQIIEITSVPRYLGI